MTKQSPFKVGIAGLGAGAMNMIPELRANPNAHIVAAADLRPQALERFSKDFGSAVYSSVEEMCSKADIDLLYVMTPDEFHAEHAIIGAENGLQILLDKPMGLTLEECDKVIEATERNNVRVIVGHSQSLDLPILKMAEIVNSGELGKPLMIHTMFYSDWIYRPRQREELMQERGGSIVRRQGPIQVDIVRMIGGGIVNSVRAAAQVADPNRPIDGSFTAFMQFEGGHAATVTYNGYGHFDSSELTYGYNLQGMPYDRSLHERTRERVSRLGSVEAEEEIKEASRYGGSSNRPIEQAVSSERRHAFFGLTLVSCEGGSIRQTPDGLEVHRGNQIDQVTLPAGPGYNRRYCTVEVDEMYRAVAEDDAVRVHDGPWGKATLEAVLAILDSSAQNQEIELHHQVPYKGIGVE